MMTVIVLRILLLVLTREGPAYAIVIESVASTN